MRKLFFLFIIALLSGAAVAQHSHTVHVIAESNYQWTGISVSQNGRIFVNYPKWNVKSPYKVAEIVDGKEVAYPSAKDNERFVCVQSVVVDALDRLWILDPANPRFGGVARTGAKLFRVNLKKK